MPILVYNQPSKSENFRDLIELKLSMFQVAWIRADTKVILTLNSLLVTQNPRYSLLDQVRIKLLLKIPLQINP